MKASSCILLLTLLTCNLLFAKRSFSQRMEDKKIMLSLNNESLSHALNKVEVLSGFRIAYSPAQVRPYTGFSMAKGARSVAAILEQLLSATDLSFTQEEGTIVIFKRVTPAVKKPVEVSLAPVPEMTPAEEAPAGPVRGRITDSTGKPCWGVNVLIKGSHRGTSTDNDGWFELKDVPEGATLVISYTGYFTKEIKVRKGVIAGVVLEANPAQIADVTVVSNGYETIPRERSTGSFDVIDQKLFNRSVSPNLMDHLNGITSGVLFDRRSTGSITTAYGNQGRTQTFSIRGLSTINSNSQPLVVVDGFPFNSQSPYYQDINSINPNDIESVTVLKDAAAASIWGARAGNGVVVITTKSGRFNHKPEVSFNTSMTVTSKPDLFSNRIISTPDYIGVEEGLYSQGKYAAYYSAYSNPAASNTTSAKPVSDVVNLLFQVQAGTLTQAQADAQIAAMSKTDVRHDMEKYFYQKGLAQQYSVSVRGGAATQKYFLSAGYDNDKGVEYSFQKRFTLTAGSVFIPVKGLEVSLPVDYSSNQTGINTGSPVQNSQISPYARLTDAGGNPVNVTYASGYAPYFIQKLDSKGFYDVSYNPINQFHAAQFNHINTDLISISPGIRYTFFNGLSAEVKYQYSKTSKETAIFASDSVWNTKNTINGYTQVASTGALSFPMNRGGQYNVRDDKQVNNNLRATLSFKRNIGIDHRVDVTAGYERNEVRIYSNYNGWYGYNPATGVVQNTIDYLTAFTNQNNAQANGPYSFTQTISPLQAGLVQQFTALISDFANGAYTYKGRYTVSGSARIDRANLFGVNTNDKGKALWSAGAAYRIDKESFYHLKWLPLLKVRATYGYQGSTPGITVRSLATINYYSGTVNSSGLSYATLNNIPNPNLRWEKVGQMNLGLDFGLKNEIVTGTLEYYNKRGSDLIAPYNIDPSTGVTTKTGNIANMTARGMDVTINTKNIDSRNFQWTSRILFSHVTDKLTRYFVTTTANAVISSQASVSYPTSITPIVGNAVYGVYSLRSAGLDASGNPQGYDTLGKVSENYSQILSYTRLKDMVYHGSGNPTYFGSFLNSFTYKGLTLSANITYKGGYYFHVQSVSYSSLFGGNMLSVFTGSSDFSKRWKNAGDEKNTYVPSMPTLANANNQRDNFYQYSSVLVQKADNLRLKDISLSYDIASVREAHKLPFSSLQVYGYFMGDILLWKANTMGVDPDYPNMNPSRAITFGVRATFK